MYLNNNNIKGTCMCLKVKCTLAIHYCSILTDNLSTYRWSL